MSKSLFYLILTFGLSAAAQSVAEKVSADLQSKNGSQVSGQIEFYQTTKGVDLIYKIKNLPANKKLGFHIHEKPDCSSIDAKSAGPHYAKMSGHEGHGTSLDSPDKYAGDLPEISANSKGVAEGRLTIKNFSISGATSGTYTLINRSIIVHGSSDDINKKAAPRIACGIIKSSAQ